MRLDRVVKKAENARMIKNVKMWAGKDLGLG
jgi:hypothetical protein